MIVFPSVGLVVLYCLMSLYFEGYTSVLNKRMGINNVVINVFLYPVSSGLKGVVYLLIYIKPYIFIIL